MEILLSGRDYHNAKLKFKAALKKHRLQWVGSLDAPRWSNENGEVIAEFARENDVTTQAKIILRLGDNDSMMELANILFENHGTITTQDEVVPERVLNREKSLKVEPIIEVSPHEYMVIEFMRKKSMPKGSEFTLSHFINYCMLNMNVPPTIVYALKDQATMDNLITIVGVDNIRVNIDPWEKKNVSCKQFEKAKQDEIDRLMHKYAPTREEKDQIMKEFHEKEARREAQKKEWKEQDDIEPKKRKGIKLHNCIIETVDSKVQRSLESNLGKGPDPLGLFGIKLEPAKKK